MQRIYEQLELGDFSLASENIRQYAETRRSYRKNQYQFPSDWKLEIEKSWNDYFDHFGYPRKSV
jgi:hypothetical protein